MLPKKRGQGSHFADILFPKTNLPENVSDSRVSFHSCPSLPYEKKKFKYLLLQLSYFPICSF